jgi:hypothetical protein
MTTAKKAPAKKTAAKKAPAKKVEPVVEPTITIDDVSYLTSSLGERGEAIITDMQRVTKRINELQFDLQIANLAQGKIIEGLKEEIPNFTVAPE